MLYDGKQIPEDLCHHLDEDDEISTDTEVGSGVSLDDDSDLSEWIALMLDLNCKERYQVINWMCCQYIIRLTLSECISSIYNVIKESSSESSNCNQ